MGYGECWDPCLSLTGLLAAKGKLDVKFAGPVAPLGPTGAMEVGLNRSYGVSLASR